MIVDLLKYRNLFLLVLIYSSTSLQAELALNLDLTDNSPAAQFTDKDWTLLKEQAKEVLNNKESGINTFWNNAESGHSGSIKSVGSIIENDGTVCRDLEFVNKIIHSVTTTQTTLCKQRGGVWQETIGRLNTTEKINTLGAEDNAPSSIVFKDEIEPVENSVKVLSETSEKCRELAAKVKGYQGQILKRSVAQERYEAECHR